MAGPEAGGGMEQPGRTFMTAAELAESADRTMALVQRGLDAARAARGNRTGPLYPPDTTLSFYQQPADPDPERPDPLTQYI